MCLSSVRFFGPVPCQPIPYTGTTREGNGTWNGYATVEVQGRILPEGERVDVDCLPIPGSRAGAGVTRQTKHDV